MHMKFFTFSGGKQPRVAHTCSTATSDCRWWVPPDDLHDNGCDVRVVVAEAEDRDWVLANSGLPADQVRPGVYDHYETLYDLSHT